MSQTLEYTGFLVLNESKTLSTYSNVWGDSSAKSVGY